MSTDRPAWKLFTKRSVQYPLLDLSTALSQICSLSTQIFLMSTDRPAWTLFTERSVQYPLLGMSTALSQICSLSTHLSRVYWQVYPLSTCRLSTPVIVPSMFPGLLLACALSGLVITIICNCLPSIPSSVQVQMSIVTSDVVSSNKTINKTTFIYMLNNIYMYQYVIFIMVSLIILLQLPQSFSFFTFFFLLFGDDTKGL